MESGPYTLLVGRSAAHSEGCPGISGPPSLQPPNVCFLPGRAVGKGVPIKTSRGRSGLIKWDARFPLRDFGEVTEKVSGIRGPWKEVPRQLGVLLSGPGRPNCFQTTGVLEVPPFSTYGPLLGAGAFPGGSVVKKHNKKSTCQCRDSGNVSSIPGLGRSPGGGDGNPLQHSCLGNPMDRGAWWRESDMTQWLSTHAHWVLDDAQPLPPRPLSTSGKKTQSGVS